MSESRQRWRLVFARDEEARYLSHLDATHLWDRAFRRGAIPVATTEGFSPRPRLIFAAPLPLGMLAEHDLADLYLAERLTLPDLRHRLEVGMPRGYRVVDLHDEWLGAPALAPQLVAADYRMTVLGVAELPLALAVGALLAADRLPRQKRREEKPITYDLRPLLLGLVARETTDAIRDLTGGAADDEPAAGLWMRLRNTQDEGSGRAEEVVAALAEQVRMAEPDVPSGESAPEAAALSDTPPQPLGLEIVRPVRERLWLASEL
jgi:radical SAM-linked protein